MLFLSVDLVGSTAFKNAERRKNLSIAHPWLDVFRGFYDGFNREFLNILSANGHNENQPRIWKAAGDELLFCMDLRSLEECWVITHGFIQALSNYRDILIKKQLPTLDVKGTGWVAGFPILNARVKVQDKEDYIGPSIDQGFRIAKFASPRHFAISLELAYLISQGTDMTKSMSEYARQLSKIPIHVDGVQELKGVLGGRPYPKIVMEVRLDEYETEMKVLRQRPEAAARPDLREYCLVFFEQVADPLLMCTPYIRSGDYQFGDIPPQHIEILEAYEARRQAEFEASAEVDGTAGGPKAELTRGLRIGRIAGTAAEVAKNLAKLHEAAQKSQSSNQSSKKKSDEKP